MNTPTPIPADLELRDIHLPDPVSWWPPAPGWWILVAILLLILLIAYITRRIYRSRALHRSVLSEIENIKKEYQAHRNQYALIQSLSTLLRRSCISFYPRQESASLTGENWLHYLDSTYPVKKSPIKKPFHQGVGKILATAPYMAEHKNVDIDNDALILLCKTWLQAQPVKNHSRPAH